MDSTQDLNNAFFHPNKALLQSFQSRPPMQHFNQISNSEFLSQTNAFYGTPTQLPIFPQQIDNERFVTYPKVNEGTFAKKETFDSFENYLYPYKEQAMPYPNERTFIASASLKTPMQNESLFQIPKAKSLFDRKDELPLFYPEANAFKGLNPKPIATYGSPFNAFPMFQQQPMVQQQQQFQQPTPITNEIPEEDELSEETKSQELKRVQARMIEGKVWTEDDDKLLLKFAIQCKCDWKKVVRKFKLMKRKVTPNFLKLRYKELIAVPVQRRNKFSHTEDLLIAKYFRLYGTNWDQVASHMPKRTGPMLKNRYYSAIRVGTKLEELLKEVDLYEANQGKSVDELYRPEDEPETFEVLVDPSQIPEEPAIKPRKPRAKVENKKLNDIERFQSEDTSIDSNLEKSTIYFPDESESIALLKDKVKMLEEMFKNAQAEIQLLKNSLNK